MHQKIRDVNDDVMTFLGKWTQRIGRMTGKILERVGFFFRKKKRKKKH